MPGRVDWNGAAWLAAFESGVRRNVSAASIYLANVVKADISQSGSLSYSPRLKSGKAGKSRKTVYNFTHSRPGNPPYLQSGKLRRSIAWELTGPGRLIGRVGTNAKSDRGAPYPLYLEGGTRRMAPRSFLRSNLRTHEQTLIAILTQKIQPGGLPVIVSNQSRSGLLGAGARSAGYF